MKQKIKRNLKKIILISLIIILSPFIIFFGINYQISNQTKNHIYHSIESIPESYTGIILGAKVYSDGSLSPMLRDRVDTAIELYNAKKIKRILVSGDHGTENYDEVNSMKDYLLEKGIPAEDIFLDHAGFDTYDSMYRAKEIFEVSNATIITNEFHLPRAIYTARELGINAQGMNADKWEYFGVEYNESREKMANIKAFIDTTFNTSPTFQGDKIPITGDSQKSWDE